MTPDGPRTDTGTDLALAGLGGLFAVGMLLWGGGACSAFICGHPIPHGHLLAGYAAFTHAGDPSAAWHAPVGPAVVYWLVTVLVLTAAGALSVLAWRVFHTDRTGLPADPARVAGLATRPQIKAAAGQRACCTAPPPYGRRSSNRPRRRSVTGSGTPAVSRAGSRSRTR